MRLVTAAGHITHFCKLVERLPVEPTFGKALAVSCVFGLQAAMARVIAVLAAESSPWVRLAHPKPVHRDCRTVIIPKQQALRRAELAGRCRSDVLAIAFLPAEFKAQPAKEQSAFCDHLGLEEHVLSELQRGAQF